MAAHSYWRIYITGITGGAADYVAISDLRFYDAAGTELAVGGTASASSVYTGDIANYGPARAFDGNNTTFWHSFVTPETTPQWLAYQFLAPVDVTSIRLQPRGGINLTNQAPTDFIIQFSDNGTSWTDSRTIVTNWSQEWYGCAFPAAATPAAGYYTNWRIMVLTVQSGGVAAAAEVEFRETSGGADIGPTAATPSYCMTYIYPPPQWPELGFDGNAGTYTTSQFGPPWWIGGAFTRAVSIRQVAWQARNDAQYGQSPTSITLQASNDGVVWVDMGTKFSIPWTFAGMVQTFDFEPPAGGMLPLLRLMGVGL